MKGTIPAAAFLIVLSFLVNPMAVQVRAATIHVDSLTDDSTGCTLREAVQSANLDADSGGCIGLYSPYGDDIINFDEKGTVTLGGSITVTDSLNIGGWGPGKTKIKINVPERVFIFDSPGNNQLFHLVNLSIGGSGSGKGGGIQLWTGDTLNVGLCRITGAAHDWAAGIDNNQGNLNIWMSVIAGNRAVSGGGGGVYSYAGALVIDSSTISGNRAVDGGGVYVSAGSASILNSTISGNLADNLSGGLHSRILVTTVTNSIIWGNRDSLGISEIGTTDGGNAAVTYSDVREWLSLPGSGNITDKPKFVDPRSASKAPTKKGDYHLRHTSPCVDTGTAVGFNEDIEDDPRPLGAGYDMGSDELHLAYNGSFEYGKGIPAPWKGKNLGPVDRRVTSKSRAGKASFLITGTSARKFLKQVVEVDGKAGDEISFGAFSKSSQALKKGGPYRVDVKVVYDTLQPEKRKEKFAGGTHRWQYRGTSFETQDDFGKVILFLRFADQAGEAWFDEVELYVWDP